MDEDHKRSIIIALLFVSLGLAVLYWGANPETDFHISRGHVYK